MAAIIASVAAHETVTWASASTVRPQASVYLRATACRSEGAPHVVAYWLKPPRSAFAAASRMRGSGSKSGNPWAKLTALSGPWSARLRRVISRITDSVKLWAFSDWRIAAPSMSGISPLQAKVGARAREALWRPLETSLPPAADLAGPARLGEEVEDVGPAQEADHLAPADHGHAAYALADQQPRRLVDPGLLGDGDDSRTHDVARRLAPLGEDVGLGDDADDVTFVGDHGGAGDVLGRQRGGDLVDRRVFAKRDHVPRHHFLDRDHLFQECSHRLEVGVAAAEDEARPATLRQLAGHMGGERQCTRRLQGQVQAGPRHLDRGGDLLLGDRHDLVDEAMLEHHLEVALPDRGRAHPVGERRRRRAERLDAARSPRPVAVVRGRRLDPDDLERRPVTLGRDRRARQQASPTQRGHHDLEVRRVLQELARDRTLAVDHVPIVEGVDEHVPALRHHLAQPLLAVGEGDPFLDHLGAERARRGDLGRVGVLWDQDQRRHTDRRSGQRDRLGVVARADGDHARRARAARDQGQDRVEGAARLERAGYLEAFGLEAQGRIEVGRHGRRAADVALDPGRCPADLLGVHLQEVGQAAAESASTAACRRGMRRRFTRTMPARMTSMPAMIVPLTVSCRSSAPQNTAVTGTTYVTAAARTAPSVFIT